MAVVVVLFDVIHVHRRPDAAHLIQFAHVIAQIGIVEDALAVAFEVAVIHSIESHQRREQAPVGLRDALADEVAMPSKTALDIVECLEQAVVGIFVGGLRGGEAATIDAVIDVVIDEAVDAVNFGASLLWIEIGAVVRQRIERGVEHTNDLGGFVTDDGATRLVP